MDEITIQLGTKIKPIAAYPWSINANRLGLDGGHFRIGSIPRNYLALMAAQRPKKQREHSPYYFDHKSIPREDSDEAPQHPILTEAADLLLGDLLLKPGLNQIAETLLYQLNRNQAIEAAKKSYRRNHKILRKTNTDLWNLKQVADEAIRKAIDEFKRRNEWHAREVEDIKNFNNEFSHLVEYDDHGAYRVKMAYPKKKFSFKQMLGARLKWDLGDFIRNLHRETRIKRLEVAHPAGNLVKTYKRAMGILRHNQFTDSTKTFSPENVAKQMQVELADPDLSFRRKIAGTDDKAIIYKLKSDKVLDAIYGSDLPKLPDAEVVRYIRKHLNPRRSVRNIRESLNGRDSYSLETATLISKLKERPMFDISADLSELIVNLLDEDRDYLDQATNFKNPLTREERKVLKLRLFPENESNTGSYNHIAHETGFSIRKVRTILESALIKIRSNPRLREVFAAEYFK